MKKYITGVIAIIIAVAAVAFKAPKHTVDMYVFEYAGTYASGEVHKLANWHYLGKNLGQCNNFNNKACRVFVTSSDVDNPVTPTALNSTVSITEGGTGSNIYVASISGSGPTSASNKSN
jgi:hypothetical protein